MKIFEVQLKSPTGEILYKSLVPECHVQEKIKKLVSLNNLREVGSIFIEEKGDISDRYIRRYMANEPDE